MTNNSYTVTTTVPPKVDIQPADMRALLDRQRASFLADGIPTYDARIDRLDRLITMLVDNKDEITATLTADFGTRSVATSLFAEVWHVVESLKYYKLHLREWMQPEIHEALLPDSEARVEFQPKGVVGVLSAWNVPWTLAFIPVGSIFAAGNRCMLKPSEFTPKTSALMARLVAQLFDKSELVVIQGGQTTGAAFTSLPFDHLIYTGSTRVGIAIMRAASENLTPLTLELGGKSPVLIGRSADLADAVRRVMTAKIFNAGQGCLLPDYVMVPKGFEDEFVVHATMAIKTMFGALKDNPDYTSIINDRHFGRLRSWIEEARQKGAKVIELNPAVEDLSDPTLRRIAPTLILDATEEMTVLKEEIFGPILPVLTYDSIDDAIAYVRNHPHPLTLYYFGQDEAEERLVLDQTISGGVTVNDCLTHALAKSLPFGGIGHSGMGAYGGKAGFLTFSHARSIYRQGKSSQAELALRPPFTPAFQASLTEAINRGNVKD